MVGLYRYVIRKMALFHVAGTCATVGVAQAQTGFGSFIHQIGGSIDVKALQGSRLSVLGRISSTGNDNASITPDHAREDARINFGYDFFLPYMTGYRFFNVDNKADQLAPAKAAMAKFAEECAARKGVIEPEASPVATRFRQEKGARFDIAHAYFTNAVSTAVCMGTSQQPLGGFVAITRTLKTPVFFVRTNRTVVYAIKGESIASAATFAAEEQERQRQQASAAAEQRRLEAWRKTVALGTTTNCGLVIDIRGPLVQVQLPGSWAAPNGSKEFWIKRSELTDHSPVYQCSFGN